MQVSAGAEKKRCDRVHEINLTRPATSLNKFNAGAEVYDLAERVAP